MLIITNMPNMVPSIALLCPLTGVEVVLRSFMRFIECLLMQRYKHLGGDTLFGYAYAAFFMGCSKNRIFRTPLICNMGRKKALAVTLVISKG